MADIRGDPWNHDAGPANSSGWAELFAETPNYRGLARAVVRRDAFRWHHGPMFYRGRLDGSAKVVIVGQEGAQDESLSHRSFTGGTGARMQHFLRFVGLDRSYLFLNSFVYPIVGQYTTDLQALAQDPVSPIAAHRKLIFDKAIVDGDVRLVVAVGRAAKESVASWVVAHGGDADPDQLHDASMGDLPSRVHLVGVLHPGGAAGGSTSGIRASFQSAVNRVRDWLTQDPGWLLVDPGMNRNLATPYPYQSAPIPYRDFPFGTCPRLGRGGTSSNRSDSQRAIRLFSAAGQYNARGAHLVDPTSAPGTNIGYDEDSGDLPYEPPRGQPRVFDPGPPSDLARLLLGGDPAFPWPDFKALGVTSDPSFGVGPIYRGRFRQVSVVVLADQRSHDDLFTGRAMSGEAGQWFQAFLRAGGITRRYLIVRTIPVDTLDLTAARRRSIVEDAKLQALHRELLMQVKSANGNLAVLVAMGPTARLLASAVAPAGVPVVELAAHGESGWSASWQAALDNLSGLSYVRDLASPTFTVPTQRSQLPRIDLPYGTPRWVGTSGDRGVRPTDTDLNKPSPDYLKVFLPRWVADLAPAALTPAEQAAADQL